MQLFSLRRPPGITPLPPPVTACGITNAFVGFTRITSPVKCGTLQWKWRRQPLRMSSSKWLPLPFLSHSLLLPWWSPGPATWDWQAVSPALTKGEQLGGVICFFFKSGFFFFSSLAVCCWIARMRSLVLMCFLGVLTPLIPWISHVGCTGSPWCSAAGALLLADCFECHTYPRLKVCAVSTSHVS